VTLSDGALVLLAAAVGGALNAVVGGGSFVAFPALLIAGVPPVSANATTTLALWPGALASTIAYRHDIDEPRTRLAVLAGASLVGGVLGAFALLHTSNTTFVRLVPWLMLLSAALFSAGGRLTARLRDRASGAGTGMLVGGALVQLLISIYGGYFGGGMGIMMLAAWSAMGMTDIHAMNGLRSLLGTLINGVALVAFVAAGAIAWAPGLLMVAGATASGYFGAALARRVDPRRVRQFVVAVAWAMTAWFFLRTYGPMRG
jgi:uncharacterized membrane protein YfcA